MSATEKSPRIIYNPEQRTKIVLPKSEMKLVLQRSKNLPPIVTQYMVVDIMDSKLLQDQIAKFLKSQSKLVISYL